MGDGKRPGAVSYYLFPITRQADVVKLVDTLS